MGAFLFACMFFGRLQVRNVDSFVAAQCGEPLGWTADVEESQTMTVSDHGQIFWPEFLTLEPGPERDLKGFLKGGV